MNRATEAKEKTEEAERKETETLTDYEGVIDEYVGGGTGGGDSLTDTENTKPASAMPSGATVIEADPSKGIVIKDSKDNEWVWIEVPKTTVFTSATASDKYDNIKADLIAYAGVYREGDATQNENWTDEWYAMDGETLVTASTEGLTDTQKALNNGCGLTYDEYQSTYQAMLSSVYTNGGFWIGRYEAGVSNTNQRTESGEITGLEAKSQKDMYPFNFVTCSQAQTLASAMSPDSRKTSSLMFGIQWDLVCKFLEGKDGLTTADINSDSTNWGNYANSPITNLSGKYAIFSQSSYTLGEWKTIPEGYTKPSSGTENWVLLSTGASEYTKKMNIYDFAGNEGEWTLEKTSGTNFPCAIRGGACIGDGSDVPASGRGFNTTSSSNDGLSFRPSLY